jgi:hypothetical protein
VTDTRRSSGTMIERDQPTRGVHLPCITGHHDGGVWVDPRQDVGRGRQAMPRWRGCRPRCAPHPGTRRVARGTTDSPTREAVNIDERRQRPKPCMTGPGAG